MLSRKLVTLILTISLALLTACAAPSTSPRPTAGQSVPGTGSPAARSYDRLPLYFVQNRGQTDPRVAFYVPGKDNTIYFAPDGLTLALTSPLAPADQQGMGPHPGNRDLSYPADQNPLPQAARRWAVKLDFVGANPDVRPVGEGKTEAVFSYFKGQPGQWQAGLPSFAQIRYPELWPGIDLVYSGLANQLKYEFVVQPGADPARIQLAYRGASAVQLTAGGQLAVTTPSGGFHDASPLAYQVKDGQRVAVDMKYALNPPATTGPAATYGYSFRLGAYDHSLPLILDPTVLVYSGYIGGSSVDEGAGIAVDTNGNAYVTGSTNSDRTTFPVLGGPDLTYNGGGDDAFVAKVNAAGTALVYAGYIGGSGSDRGSGIAVDTNGNAYVTGWTTSDQTTFPVLGGPDLTYNGGSDAFVAKVNAAGTALVYSGYIGGSGDDRGDGIAVDTNGNAYVTGATRSDQTTFPVLGGPDLTYNGGGDAFVAMVNAAGTALVYAGYIGGSNYDGGGGIAVDKDGNAYVTGVAESDQTTFPVTTGPDLTYNGGLNDAFVAKVNAAGTALVFAGYIGGSSYDYGSGIAVDTNGNAYVTGSTDSDQATFPVTVGPDLTFNGGIFTADAFVAKVNAAGTALVYAGYIGGAGFDQGAGIAVDTNGNAYVTGYTNSDQSTFPVLGGPGLTFGGFYDAFVAKVNAAGMALVYAGYIGGSGDDEGYGIAVDGAGNAYVTGSTTSDQATFPVTVGPDLTYNGGYSDAFVAKVGTPFVPSVFLYLPLVRR
jgi:Beta-propeller repeat